MPPIHPALVHFPIALVIFSFIADLFGYFRNNETLRAAGFWSLVGAAVSIPLVVAAGYYDMNRAALGETHEYVAFHMKTGWALLVSVILLTIWRSYIYAKAGQRLNGLYLGAAFLVLALTAFQGWYGSEMVYSQGAGVAAAGKGTEPPKSGHQRLEAVTFGSGHGGHEEGSEHKKSSEQEKNSETNKNAEHNDNHSH